MSEFPDQNMKLIVIQGARYAGLLPAFNKQAFFRDVLHEEFDDNAEYNYQLDERVREYLLAMPLPAELLRQIKTLEWDGGIDVFSDIWTYWSGETDDFTVHDVTGIEQLTGLERVFLDVDDLRPFLSLPKLTKLRSRHPDTAENRAVIAELERRGVEVK